MEEADAILVRSADMHQIAVPGNVKCVARAGAGVNNIPLMELAQQGIPVFNTPGANANGVKELVFAAMLLAACLLTDARLDSFFPLYGEGDASILAALKAGGSLAWPVSLLLTLEPPIGQGRLRSAILPAFAAVAALLVLAATVPHELLIRQAMCLTMLAFFLSIGASAQLGTASLCMPWQRVPAWLPYAVLAGMFLTQAADVSSLWDTLQAIEPWLLTPLAGIAILCLTIALIRRKAA